MRLIARKKKPKTTDKTMYYNKQKKKELIKTK